MGISNGVYQQQQQLLTYGINSNTASSGGGCGGGSITNKGDSGQITGVKRLRLGSPGGNASRLAAAQDSATSLCGLPPSLIPSVAPTWPPSGATSFLAGQQLGGIGSSGIGGGGGLLPTPLSTSVEAGSCSIPGGISPMDNNILAQLIHAQQMTQLAQQQQTMLQSNAASSALSSYHSQQLAAIQQQAMAAAMSASYGAYAGGLPTGGFPSLLPSQPTASPLLAQQQLLIANASATAASKRKQQSQNKNIAARSCSSLQEKEGGSQAEKAVAIGSSSTSNSTPADTGVADVRDGGVDEVEGVSQQHNSNESAADQEHNSDDTSFVTKGDNQQQLSPRTYATSTGASSPSNNQTLSPNNNTQQGHPTEGGEPPSKVANGSPTHAASGDGAADANGKTELATGASANAANGSIGGGVASSTAAIGVLGGGGGGSGGPTAGGGVDQQQQLHDAAPAQQTQPQPGSVLRVIVDTMLYPVTLDVLYAIFARYGKVLRIITFNKNNTFQALVQLSEAKAAAIARAGLDGQNIYNGCCTLRIDYSKMATLNVKYNNEKSRDYTRPDLPAGDVLPPLSAADQLSLVNAAAMQQQGAGHHPFVSSFNAAAAAGGGGVAPISFSPAAAAAAGTQYGSTLNLNAHHSAVGGGGGGSVGQQQHFHHPSPPQSHQLHQQHHHNSHATAGGGGVINPFTAAAAAAQLNAAAAALASAANSSSPANASAAVSAAAAALQFQQQLGSLLMATAGGTMGAAGGGGCGNVPVGCSPVVLVSGLDENVGGVLGYSNTTDAETLPSSGVYGDVKRVKILFNKKENALIQYAEPQQAVYAVQHLDKVPMLGKSIRVSFSKHTAVQMPKEGQPDAGLTKDYEGSALHRFKKPGSKNFANIFPPSSTLHLSNIPADTSEEFLVSAFRDKGFPVREFQFFQRDHKMALVELEDVGTAVDALIALHNFPLAEQSHLRVSFSRKPINASFLGGGGGANGGGAGNSTAAAPSVNTPYAYGIPSTAHYSGGGYTGGVAQQAAFVPNPYNL